MEAKKNYFAVKQGYTSVFLFLSFDPPTLFPTLRSTHTSLYVLYKYTFGSLCFLLMVVEAQDQIFHGY
jgi:hypothetical protein